jgi:predicted membrane channel-forming protein YqfA (hemolysin III family)
MKALKITSIVFIVLGILLFLVGYMFRIMHWPDLYQGFYSGPIVFLMGLILLIIRKIKN